MGVSASFGVVLPLSCSHFSVALSCWRSPFVTVAVFVRRYPQTIPIAFFHTSSSPMLLPCRYLCLRSSLVCSCWCCYCSWRSWRATVTTVDRVYRLRRVDPRQPYWSLRASSHRGAAPALRRVSLSPPFVFSSVSFSLMCTMISFGVSCLLISMALYYVS